MANTKKVPTKAEIQQELTNTQEELNSAQQELTDTQSALKEAMDLIKQLKSQQQQTTQVVVQNDNKAMTKIKCINLAHNIVNISTLPNGQGRVFTFHDYGQVNYIRYDELLDIISAYPNTMESGIIYIADKDFRDEQGICNGDTVYTPEIVDKIVYLRDDIDVDMLMGMSKPLLESTVRKIAELYNAGEEMEPNKLKRIQDELGYDIDKLAKDIKILDDEELEMLDE